MIPLTPRDLLISRIMPGTARCEHLRGVIGNLFGLSGRLANERARLSADRNISDVGRREELSKVAKSLVKNLAELSRPARVARMDFAAKRAAIKVRSLDSHDAVGELRRQEVRTYLRSLPFADRVPALDTLGDDAVLAVLDAAPSLSGLPPDRHEFIKARYLEKLFGPQMKDLESIEDDYVCVESAQQMVGRDLQAASGLGANDFAELVKSHEI